MEIKTASRKRNPYIQGLVKEAAATGLLLLAVQSGLDLFEKHAIHLPLVDTAYRRQILIALSGATAHLLLEYTGWNDWYVKHGAATRKTFLEYQESLNQIEISGQGKWTY